MKSVFDFIVEPKGKRYSNEISVGGKDLILNSNIETFKFINRVAIVKEIPIAYKTPIEVGDEILIHHNVFRRYYNQKGEAVDSSKLFNDNEYFCQLDQVYLYKKKGGWNTLGQRCFIMPIKNNDNWSLDAERRNIGILKMGNKTLSSLGVNEGDLVGFKSNREFEFIVDNQRLYCMESNDILVKYDHEGSEEEYNPSWAKSS